MIIVFVRGPIKVVEGTVHCVVTQKENQVFVIQIVVSLDRSQAHEWFSYIRMGIKLLTTH